MSNNSNSKNTSVTPPLHFARYEFKYILAANKRKAVEDDLYNFLDYDPFVATQPGLKYFVRSLYFDDPSYSAFYDKVDGLHSRYKFRLRTYTRSIDQNVPIYLEMKGRHNNLVYKHRTPMEKIGSDLESLDSDLIVNSILSHARKSDVLSQFTFDLFRKRLKPVALIDYERRPYISKYDPNFRITFDEGLTATNTSGLFPDGHFSSRKVQAGNTVVEIKFRHHIPSWFHRVIQTHELKRVSISKICSGMETLGIASDNY